MSMAGVEGLILSEWVVAALVGDAQMAAALGVVGPETVGARVWEGIAPEGTPYPFVTFTVAEPQDWTGVGTTRVMSKVGLTVKATSRGRSYAPIKAVAQRIDAALQGVLNVPTSGGGRVLSVIRQNGLQYPEQDGGEDYRHLGGVYEAHVQ